MTQTVLVAGTASHVGKSTIVTGLCRHLRRRGCAVTPFKAQNMSNNAHVALTPNGEWGEIGVSQYVQCQAARTTPTTDVNPILLKPRGNQESQLIIHGQPKGHYSASTFYQEHWEQAREAALESYRRLTGTYDVIVAEGAGSIAEINLHDRDLANAETAEFANASIILVVDIERGGAFASIYGTLELMPEHIRQQVSGVIINKFRGDERLLEPGISDIEELTGVPVIGVIPYENVSLPAEDSASLPDERSMRIFGEDDEIPDEQSITIAVPRLPRISNFTDLDPLIRTPGVRVACVPLHDEIDGYDAVILPGTKNTVDDLLALKDAGFDEKINEFDGPIVGICGGFQMVGQRITNAEIESTTASGNVNALGLLPVITKFSQDKHVARVRRTVSGAGPIAGATGDATGYEIHMGDAEATGPVSRPLGQNSCATDRILGTYMHGIFENDAVRDSFIANIYDSSEKDRPSLSGENLESGHERAANLVTEHVDLKEVGLEPTGLVGSTRTNTRRSEQSWRC